jgi:glutathione S-transferase
MKLFYTATSPYARKVRATLLEKGLGERIELVPCNLEAPDAALLAANPAGKIPTLMLESGEALYDSPVICEWLDLEAGTPLLLPAQGPTRWRVLRSQALADAVMDDALAVVMELRRGEEQRSATLIEKRTAALRRSVTALEQELAAWPGSLTLAHIAAGCALGYLDLRLSDLAWRAGHDRLAQWFAELAERPSMRATRPE